MDNNAVWSRLLETLLNGSRVCAVCLGIGLHIIESAIEGWRLNGGARISLVLSSGLLYMRQCGEYTGTESGMETSETLPLSDS